MAQISSRRGGERQVQVHAGMAGLEGNLTVPPGATGIVLFAHGSGSSRRSPRNRAVASALQQAGLATLLFDLLTEDEGAEDAISGHLRFDIPLLAGRLTGATDWTIEHPDVRHLRVGLFGSSTGAAAALIAAAERPDVVGAVVSRGGRPDLAGLYLERVQAPTLLIVGAADTAVLEINEEALERLGGKKDLAIIPGATHLFEEPGTLEEVSRLAADWFVRHLAPHPIEARV